MTEPDQSTVPLLTSVFVYGTLMPGERNEAVARQGGAPECERASLDGALLCDLRPEAYPALLEGPGTVHGYLYTYAAADWAAALPMLDDLEGLHLAPPLYRRAEVTVRTAGGQQRPAWVYFYAREERSHSPGCLPVPSGRWEDVPQREQPGEPHAPDDGRRR